MLFFNKQKEDVSKIEDKLKLQGELDTINEALEKY